MTRETREELADLAGRAARCPAWEYRPGMAILPLEGSDCDPIRIAHVAGELIWLFVPALADIAGPASALRPIAINESPLVDLSDPATMAIAEALILGNLEPLPCARSIVAELEQDLPF